MQIGVSNGPLNKVITAISDIFSLQNFMRKTIHTTGSLEINSSIRYESSKLTLVKW